MFPAVFALSGMKDLLLVDGRIFPIYRNTIIIRPIV